MVAQHARQEPHHRIDDTERRRLAPRQHEIAQRQLLGREPFGDPFYIEVKVE